MNGLQCAQRIATSEGVRQCRNRAAWYVAERSDRGVCSAHRRSYDIRPIPKAPRCPRCRGAHPPFLDCPDGFDG